jgi:putative chitinase
MKIITNDVLAKLLPRNKNVDEWCDLLNELLPLHEVNLPVRVAAFIAQCSHESSQFNTLQENLNYSGDALGKIFGKYFKDKDTDDYHRQPEKIANVIYADRMGNGDTESGEGYKFRGRGVIQLTGKENYSKFADSVDMSLEEVIEYLETKRGALHSALWYWDSRNLNDYADAQDIKGMTKRINGGYIGLSERTEHYEHALELMGVDIHETDVTIGVTTLLEIGSTGPEVVIIQKLLSLDADGDFGPATFEAVMEFQMENELVPDGMVGAMTYARMKTLLP